MKYPFSEAQRAYEIRNTERTKYYTQVFCLRKTYNICMSQKSNQVECTGQKVGSNYLILLFPDG